MNGLNGISTNMMDSHSIQMSFSKYVSTGNPIIDNLVLTMVGIVFTGLLSFIKIEYIKKAFLYITGFFRSKNKTKTKYNRVVINQKLQMNKYGETINSLDNFDKNNYLMLDAFYFYLSKNIDKIKSSELGLIFKQSNNHSVNDRVRDFDLGIRPKDRIKIDKFYITFNIESKNLQPPKSDENGDNNKKSYSNKNEDKMLVFDSEEKTLIVESKLPTKEIQNFISEIYTAYIDKYYPKPAIKKEKIPKYYYVKVTEKENSNTSSGGIFMGGNNDHPEPRNSFVRYELKSKTTFSDIFFQDKEKLINRIDKFLKGETKLSKFTLMLHGPPGGGKSSFIKALHNYVDCHIIVVKLSQFENIDDLMDIFFNPVIKFKDGSGKNPWSVIVPINKRIYLFEDVDAEDKIVLKGKKIRILKKI